MRTSRQKGDHDTGRPTREDKWPRIVQVPNLIDGHAHLRGTKVPVYRVLRELAHERLPVPEILAAKGITDADQKAALLYAADVMQELQQLITELQRLYGPTPEIRSMTGVTK